MNKTVLIIKNEIYSNFSRFSFLFVCFGIPLMVFLFFLLSSAFSGKSVSQVGSRVNNSKNLKIEGVVDQSGILKTVPPEAAGDKLIVYPGEPLARQAVIEGKITAFYLIPADYLKKGRIFYITPQINLNSLSTNKGTLQWIILVNLLNGDTRLAADLLTPLEIKNTRLDISLDKTRAPAGGNPVPPFIPYIFASLITTVILMSSGLFLNSFFTERENRVLEVLLLSVEPRQLITSKIIGFGFVGLVQMAVWSGSGFLIFNLFGPGMQLPVDFHIPFSVLVYGMIFFLLAFFLNAGILSGIGVLTSNFKQASQFAAVLTIPLFFPLAAIHILSMETHSVVFLIFGLFPITAPVGMMMLLTSGPVPFWQPLLSAVILFMSIIFTIRLTARFFSAQTMLGGKRSKKK